MFKIISAVLLGLYFAFQLFLSILRYKNRKAPIPEELSDVYDEPTYLKWKEYSAEKIKVGIISDSVNFAITLALLLSDVFALICRDIANEYVSAIIVLAIYMGINVIVGAIFDYIYDMKIEQKYGFNKTTMKTFIADQIKGLIISSILFLGLTCLFILIYNSLHDYILILFTAIIFVIILFISFLYPVLSKLFNKFTSLEEGELRTSLTNMLESHGYQVRDIKVMDASRRTTKSNAYFAGFGKSKTIVLYDNLLKVMTNEQIVAIFAHEMGHGLHKDTLKNSILSLLNIAIIVVLAWLLARYPEIYHDFGFEGVNYGFAVILLANVVLPFVSTLLGFLTSYISRRAEYRADEQAYKEGYAEHLITALKNLSRENLSDLNPHPLIVLLMYSHPTLLQRIRAIRKLEESQK